MDSKSYREILTIDEAMEVLRIGRNQCYDLLKSGKIKGFKIKNKTWKIPLESIETFIKTDMHIMGSPDSSHQGVKKQGDRSV